MHAEYFLTLLQHASSHIWSSIYRKEIGHKTYQRRLLFTALDEYPKLMCFATFNTLHDKLIIFNINSNPRLDYFSN